MTMLFAACKVSVADLVPVTAMALATVMSPASAPAASVLRVTLVPPLRVLEMVFAAMQLVPVQEEASMVILVGSISQVPPLPLAAAAITFAESAT